MASLVPGRTLKGYEDKMEVVLLKGKRKMGINYVTGNVYRNRK